MEPSGEHQPATACGEPRQASVTLEIADAVIGQSSEEEMSTADAEAGT